MTPARHSALVQGLSSIEAKVYAHTTVTDRSTTDIYNTMVAEGSGLSKANVDRILNALSDKGLLRKLGPDIKPTWARFEVRRIIKPVSLALPAKEVAAAPVDDPDDKPPMKDPDMLDKISALSTTLRDIAKAIDTAADQLDDLALDVEHRIATAEQGAGKLRQLQELLKGIA